MRRVDPEGVLLKSLLLKVIRKIQSERYKLHLPYRWKPHLNKVIGKFFLEFLFWKSCMLWSALLTIRSELRQRLEGFLKNRVRRLQMHVSTELCKLSLYGESINHIDLCSSREFNRWNLSNFSCLINLVDLLAQLCFDF